MDNNLPPVVGVNTGQKSVIRNVGVARVTGSNLLAQGKNINWLYYIVDIASLAVFENQSNDVWFGPTGIPVAGNTAVFAALGPAFEGQKFFNIQTNTPLTYKNGAWGGTGWAIAQPTSPTTVVVKADESVTANPNLDYLIIGDNATVNLNPTLTWLTGHTVNVKVTPGSTGGKLVAAAPALIYTVTSPAGVQELAVSEGQEYAGVHVAGNFYLFTDSEDTFLRKGNNLSELTDVNEARQNLQVLSISQSVSLVNSVTGKPAGGIIFEGDVSNAELPRTARLDFATPEEVIAGVPNKVVTPETLQSTYNELVDDVILSSKYNSVTGLTVTSSGFTVTALSAVSLGYTAANCVFNGDPALASQELVKFDIEAGSVTLPAAAGWTLYDLLVDVTGVVNLTVSTTLPPSKLRLAYVLSFGGNIIEIATCPQIVTTEYATRALGLAFTGGDITPNVGVAGTLAAATFTVAYESVNWGIKLPDVHKLTLPAAAPLSMQYTEGTTLGALQTVVDGRKLVSGSATAAQFVVQRLYRTMLGSYFMVPTATAYASMAAAETAAASLQPTLIVAFNTYAREVARVLLKGDQYAGSGTLDLNDVAKCKVIKVSAAEGSSGASSGTAANFVTLTAGSALEANKRYLLAATAVFTVPSPSLDNLWFSIKVREGFQPTLQFGTDEMVDVMDGSLHSTQVYDVPPDSEDVYVAHQNKWRF